MSQPSAQSVGREFVRQYYTMLNEAPEYLHRFYSHNSSFVHGGVEKPGEELSPAIGQTEIHKKITSLDFKDCHVKILQVDSQAGVEGSFVIQVVGELSNNGSPMRRFMQTFVLASQSPKKYYVHNDIFRYQDEIFQDEGTPGEGEVDGESYEHEYAENSEVEQLEPVSRERTPSGYIATEQPNIAAAEQPHPISNGDVYAPSVALDMGQQQPVYEQAPAVSEAVAAVVPESAEQPAAGLHSEPSTAAAVPETSVTAGEAAVLQQVVGTEHPVQPVAPAQKPTWAAMAAMGSNKGAPPIGQVQVQATPKPQATIRPEPKADQGLKSSPTNGALPQRPPRASQTPQDALLSPGDAIRSGGGGLENGKGGVQQPEDDGGRFRGGVGSGAPVYPDSQQIFVGNVPHTVNDLELKEYFEAWGSVVDIRINRKPSNNLPNFGFVTFDSHDAVRNILNAMPLPKMHGKHRINVEEKKPREELSGRPRSGTRPPQSVNPSKSFGRDSYSPRGGGRGGGGPYSYGRGGGRDNGGGYVGTGRGGQNGGPGNLGGGQGGRSYTRSTSSDDGRVAPPPQGEGGAR